MTYELKCGHVVDELRKLPAGSVHCVITSPPYYGLRSYGTPPQIWDGDPECAHDFGDDAPRPGTAARNGEGGNSCFAGREDKAEINAGLAPASPDPSAPSDSSSEALAKEDSSDNATPPPRPRTANDVINPDSKQATNRGAQYDATGGAICSKCGAWRGHLGLEPTPDLFVHHLVQIFREVRRVLRKDGTFWLNLGDSYNAARDGGHAGGGEQAKLARHSGIARSGANVPGLKPKDLMGIPWRVALALQADGWWLRSDIIWHKPNPMPESTRDRCTRSHEYIFMLTKSARYYYDWFAITEPIADVSVARLGLDAVMRPGKNSRMHQDRDPNHPDTRKPVRFGGNKGGDGSRLYSGKVWHPTQGGGGKGFAGHSGNTLADGTTYSRRNKRDVWTVTTRSFKEAHFATFPAKLIEPMILAGTSDTGCCPACGAPRERITRTETKYDHTTTAAGKSKIGPYASQTGDGEGTHDVRHGVLSSSESTGWQPTCKCDIAEVVPCTVLDPFNGAATTGIVALRHGRNYIGIELKPEYVEMSRRRIEAELAKASLFAGNQIRPIRPIRPIAEEQE